MGSSVKSALLIKVSGALSVLTPESAPNFYYTPRQHFCQEKICTSFSAIFSRYLCILPSCNLQKTCYNNNCQEGETPWAGLMVSNVPQLVD